MMSRLSVSVWGTAYRVTVNCMRYKGRPQSTRRPVAVLIDRCHVYTTVTPMLRRLLKAAALRVICVTYDYYAFDDYM